MVYIALLRAINVSGHNRILMADLREMLAGLGLSNVRTLLQSGNLVFESRGKTGAQLEALLEAETERRFAVRTPYLVRTAREWAAIVAANPFAREAREGPAHLVVWVQKSACKAGDAEALRAAVLGPEYFTFVRTHGYLVYPVDMGHSKLTSGLIEKWLGSPGTARNWNTVLKLLALSLEKQ